MENTEAVQILKYVLGLNEERKGTKMYDNGITLYPDVMKEREAIRQAIKVLEATENMVAVELVTSEYFVAKKKPVAKLADPSDIKFGEF